jgi:serralysin
MFPSDAFWSDASCFNRRDVFGLAIGLAAGGLASRPCAAATPASATPCVELRSWYADELRAPGKAGLRANSVQESIKRIQSEKGISLRNTGESSAVAAALGPSKSVSRLESAVQSSLDGEYSSTNEALIDTQKLWRGDAPVYYEFVSGRVSRLFDYMEAAIAEWSQHCCLTFKRGRNPRTGFGDIRISFVSRVGHYSNIGIDSRERRLSVNRSGAAESLNVDPEGGDDTYLRAVCLHELGHAIGLQHEHQNPNNAIRWDEEAVRARLSKLGWDDEKIKQNVLTVLRGGQYRSTPGDRESIMMYWFSPEEAPDGSQVPRSPNLVLSDTDKQFVRENYRCSQAPPEKPKLNEQPATANQFREKLDEIREIQSLIRRP